MQKKGRTKPNNAEKLEKKRYNVKKRLERGSGQWVTPRITREKEKQKKVSSIKQDIMVLTR